ncbi:hypothetical protein N2603_40360 [Bradyrhizobium huanghuaihaiense]|uniref:hypothetical protein n=1 Tax=Bradyrhizobium huanghuaihaiense TaxID=990078 RepID=UPI0021A99507|nr:hypothetical protein [Bradyrhizobium sp. CB3035]UWU76102.1 hypothetical protein N2603_40360 [Bradyrhizobium sp. CB3035]
MAAAQSKAQPLHTKKFRAHYNLVTRVGAHRSLIEANRFTELSTLIDELRLGRPMLQADRPSATKRAKLWLPAVGNTSLSVDICDCRSDASLSMEDDRKPVETPSRSVVSLRRGWHHAAAFAAQVLEIVPKTKHGHVHIATPCKAITEAHHVWSARGQDFLGPPISRASVACAPRRCDRDPDRNEGGCTAMRIGNPAHSSLLTHQICLKPHIGNSFSFVRGRTLFTGASAAMVTLLRGQPQ